MVSLKRKLNGHRSVLHIFVVVVFPVQCCAPFGGDGSLQDLVFVTTPPPHGLVQFPELIQLVKLLSTIAAKDNF